jgi:hypothetical protein
MARRGPSKRLSVDHENYIANLFDGVRSKSSGAAVTDPGDVRCEAAGKLIECKLTGSVGKPAKSISVQLNVLEKIAKEAWEHSMQPALALRIVHPGHLLADKDGNIDLIVHLMSDYVEENATCQGH